jgi:hypothetical protein
LRRSRTSQRRLSFTSHLTASAQVSFAPVASVTATFDATRKT